MPSLTRLIEVIGPALTTDASEIERRIRLEFGGERIYCPPLESRKDPARVRQIVEMSQRLPTRVVAARIGCSEGYVRRVVRSSRPAKSPANPRDSG